MKNIKPKAIVKYLDRYIIGQDKAKKTVAIALRNRWRRQQLLESIRKDILPNNIILIGSTGVGKTEISRRLAELMDSPFIKVEASKFTEVGYVGRDVEAMIRDLVDMAVTRKKEEVYNKNSESIKKSVEVIAHQMYCKQISDISLEEFREKLDDDELDSVQVEAEITEVDGAVATFEVMTPFRSSEEISKNLQDVIESMTPKQKKKKKLKIPELIEHLFQDEMESILDQEAIIREAVEEVEENGIVFLDEIDKICGEKSGNGPDISREGVQRDLLPIIEGTSVFTKYGIVKTDYMLFIAAGAFHVSAPSDLIPELQGRFPIRVEMDDLTVEDYERILKEPENSLIKQYKALFSAEDVEISFSVNAIKKIAEKSFLMNEKGESIGARRLHTMLTLILEDELFNAPELSGKKIKIKADKVEKEINAIMEDEDLSKYIL